MIIRHVTDTDRRWRVVTASIVSLMIFSFVAMRSAGAEEVVNALDNNVAMDGFDVVAYFEQDAPAKGLAAHQVSYKDKIWYFTSQEHADLFLANPQSYEPQFNGWCAYAVSEGYAAEVDFINGWAVLDGKLYLNWDADVRDDFLRRQDKRIRDADAKWPDVRDGLQDGSTPLYRHKDVPSSGISHPQEL